MKKLTTSLLVLAVNCLLVTVLMLSLWIGNGNWIPSPQPINGTGGLTNRTLLLTPTQQKVAIADAFSATAVPNPAVPESCLNDDPYNFCGINFASNQKITIKFFSGLGDLAVTFTPSIGSNCDYTIFTNEGEACVFASENHIHVSCHSGLTGGECEAIRFAIEGGTLLSPKLDSLELIAKKIAKLSVGDSDVVQGQIGADVNVAFVVRIPPQDLKGEVNYLDASPQKRLEIAAKYNPAITALIESGVPLFTIDTCERNHQEETDFEGVTATTGAILFIGLTP